MKKYQIEQKKLNFELQKQFGEVAERLKAHAWKACKRETVSRVRIPFSPPFLTISQNLQSSIK